MTETTNQETALDIYRMRRRMGGVRHHLGGVDYTRSVEYPFVLGLLELETAERVLEIGSSDLLLAPYIATHFDVELHATDLDPVVQRQQKWIRSLGREDLLESGRFVVKRQDATELDYPDERFDRVVSVSTIEHIPQTQRAAAEMSRVLAPEGLAVVSVPFSLRARDIYLNRQLYSHSREYDDTPQFFEHVFDRPTLERDVIRASGLQVQEMRFLGEPGLKMSRLVYHRALDAPLRGVRWLWPRFAHRWYREIPESRVTDGTENIAVVVLRKPAGYP
jgi:SAM-dependent methyltransferase